MRAQLVPAHPKSIDAAAPASPKGTLSELGPAVRGGQPEPRVVSQIFASGSLGGTTLHARSPAPAVTCGAPPLRLGTAWD